MYAIVESDSVMAIPSLSLSLRSSSIIIGSESNRSNNRTIIDYETVGILPLISRKTLGILGDSNASRRRRDV